MYLTAMISAAPMILIVARAEARSRFGACVSASANSIERKSALMYVTARAGTVQGKSVHRFIARSAFRRFSRSGFAPNHRESSLHRGPDDFVFCKKDGSALDPDVLRKDALYPILDRLGIPRKKGASGFHTFRHSAASIVNEQTGNLKLAQKFLGHSTIEMTAGIYTHTSAQAEREAAVALERAIYGDLFPVVPNIANRNNSVALI